VRWLWRCDKEPQRFESYTLKLGETVQVLDSKPVLDWIAALPADEEAFQRPLKEAFLFMAAGWALSPPRQV
jgi:hypothetical protein